MRTAVIVQARMGSTRLPGKVMRPLAGEPALRHVLRRCLAIQGVDTVVCAVPREPESLPLVAEALSFRDRVEVVMGDEKDVLARYCAAARFVRADIVMRITSDCPLIDPAVCRQVLCPVWSGDADYSSNVLPRTYPKGLDCEAFTMALLGRAAREATTPYDREHVTPFMQREGAIRRANLDGPGDFRRVTLDTPEDYAVLSEIFANLPAGRLDWPAIREAA